MDKGKWVVLTKEGVYAPSNRVWHDTDCDALAVCVFNNDLRTEFTIRVDKVSKNSYSLSINGEQQFFIKHQGVLNPYEMGLIASEQNEIINNLEWEME